MEGTCYGNHSPRRLQISKIAITPLQLHRNVRLRADVKVTPTKFISDENISSNDQESDAWIQTQETPDDEDIPYDDQESAYRILTQEVPDDDDISSDD